MATGGKRIITVDATQPRAHVLLVGSDEVAYGAKRGDGLSWREWALKEWPMDPSRLHQCRLSATRITSV